MKREDLHMWRAFQKMLKALRREKTPTIHVCLAADEGYATPLTVTLTSLLYHARRDDDLQIYILDGGLSNSTKDKISGLRALKDFRIQFLEMDNEVFKNCPLTPGTPFNIVSYYRMKIPSLLPEVDKILYLDSDTIVKRSLRKLFDTDIDGYYGAAAKTQTCEQNRMRLGLPENAVYFNSGVMVINCPKWREDHIEGKLFSFVETSPPEMLWNSDQDAINAVLFNKFILLEQNWNAETRTDITPSESYRRILENPYIIHYLGVDKPWSQGTRHDTAEYQRYLNLSLNPVLCVT